MQISMYVECETPNRDLKGRVNINSWARLLSGNLEDRRYRDIQEPPKTYRDTFLKRNFNSQ